MHVLDARRRVRHLVHGVGLGVALRDAAQLAFDVDVDVALFGAALVVQYRRVHAHRRDRIEHRGQDFIRHFEQRHAASAAPSVSATTAATR
jgi:hypothetical protein